MFLGLKLAGYYYRAILSCRMSCVVSLTDQTIDWKIRPGFNLENFPDVSSKIFSGLIVLSFIYLADNENILFSGLLVSEWRMMVAV